MTKPRKPAPAPPAKNRARAGQFAKGQSGNPAGRAPGVPNKATREIKAFVLELFENQAFQKKLRERWIALDLEPGVFALLLHYAFGKPPTSIAVSLSFDHAKYLSRAFDDEALDEAPTPAPRKAVTH